HAAQRAGTAVPLQLRRVPRPRVQAHPRRQGPGLDRKVRPPGEAVRVDPRDRVPERERNLRWRVAELARAEDHHAPARGEDVNSSRWEITNDETHWTGTRRDRRRGLRLPAHRRQRTGAGVSDDEEW